MNLPPTDWPDPPLLSHLVLESPWALAVVLLLVGVALVFIARRSGRGHAGPAYVGCVLMALAVLVPIIAYLVETGRERIAQNTRELALAPEDPFDLQTILDLTTQDVRLIDMNREGLIALALRFEEAVRIEDVRVTNLMTVQDSETYGRSYVAVLGRFNSSQGISSPFKVQAVMRWRREPDGKWRMHQIEQMAIDGVPVQQLGRGI